MAVVGTRSVCQPGDLGYCVNGDSWSKVTLWPLIIMPNSGIFITKCSLPLFGGLVTATASTEHLYYSQTKIV